MLFFSEDAVLFYVLWCTIVIATIFLLTIVRAGLSIPEALGKLRIGGPLQGRIEGGFLGFLETPFGS